MKNNYAYGSLASYVMPEEICGISAGTCRSFWTRTFGRCACMEVEIGFGTGEYLVRMAQENPEVDFVGLEQCPGRILSTLRRIHREKVPNIRLVYVDAALAFEYLFDHGEISRVHCLFPCPWPKKRHFKHRLFSRGFLKLVNSRLVNGGVLKFVTDHYPYTAWVMDELPETGFEASARRIPATYGTKFEKKWASAGQKDFDELLLCKKNGNASVVPSPRPGACMKIYFLEAINPDAVVWQGCTGAVTVEFKDFIFDRTQDMGMIQAVVNEDNRTQYLWMSIAKTAKQWRLAAANGHGVLPTPGIQKALELAYRSFAQSVEGV